MIKYKLVETANGRTMYFKNGKMVGKSEMPADILPRLSPGVELQMASVGDTEPAQPEQTVDQEPEDNGQSDSQAVGGKECIFCGESATKQRFVNLKIAMLCDGDYSSHTTGEIAAQIREYEKVSI